MPTREPCDIVAAAPELGERELAGPANYQRTATTDSEHMTFNETAAWLLCSTRTLQRLLETGSGPPVIRISERRLIFRKADVRHWLAGRTSGRTETAPPRRRGRPPKQNNTQIAAR
jgi:predicted DNA-binding transcriptional regulator AlpA